MEVMVEEDLNKDYNLSAKQLLQIICKKLLEAFRSIETRSEKVGNQARNRKDVFRCLIYRAISKIPYWILKELVSVGDMKHSSPERLYKSYEKALNGFMEIEQSL